MNFPVAPSLMEGLSGSLSSSEKSQAVAEAFWGKSQLKLKEELMRRMQINTCIYPQEGAKDPYSFRTYHNGRWVDDLDRCKTSAAEARADEINFYPWKVYQPKAPYGRFLEGHNSLFSGESVTCFKNIREELQYKTDKWLKGVKLRCQENH